MIHTDLRPSQVHPIGFGGVAFRWVPWRLEKVQQRHGDLEHLFWLVAWLLGWLVAWLVGSGCLICVCYEP